jgi:hypothetical protein
MRPATTTIGACPAADLAAGGEKPHLEFEEEEAAMRARERPAAAAATRERGEAATVVRERARARTPAMRPSEAVKLARASKEKTAGDDCDREPIGTGANLEIHDFH